MRVSSSLTALWLSACAFLLLACVQTDDEPLREAISLQEYSRAMCGDRNIDACAEYYSSTVQSRRSLYETPSRFARSRRITLPEIRGRIEEVYVEPRLSNGLRIRAEAMHLISALGARPRAVDGPCQSMCINLVRGGMDAGLIEGSVVTAGSRIVSPLYVPHELTPLIDVSGADQLVPISLASQWTRAVVRVSPDDLTVYCALSNQEHGVDAFAIEQAQMEITACVAGGLRYPCSLACGDPDVARNAVRRLRAELLGE